MTIRAGILGYGNLGRGVEAAVQTAPDMELAAVFTRRDPKSVKTLTGVPVVSAGDAAAWADRIDVMILGGGSATDLPRQTPEFAKLFNCVDSFDTHAKIPEHFEAVDQAAPGAGKLTLISCGWDPGLFSVLRCLSESVLPRGRSYTFWGRGVSQGHSDAIRRVEGVRDARQYTVPVEKALEEVRSGANPELTARQMHTRECYVVAKGGADKEKIASRIRSMPNYFEPYDTTVNFISEEELQRDHQGLPHGGFVLRSGTTGLKDEMRERIEFRLKLDSNPQFTGSVLAACARAVVRMRAMGQSGCRTLLDVAPAWLSPREGAELRKALL